MPLERPVAYDFRQRDDVGTRTGAGIKAALVSMPWHNPFVPSIQLGALKAYVERELPGAIVDTFHYYLELEEIIGLKAAREISERSSLCEALSAGMLFPDKIADVLRFAEAERSKQAALAEVDFVGIIEPMAAAARRRAERIDWSQYDCIGFSLVFGQTMASMFMAKLIKERVPDALIVVGGPSCSGRVGASLLQVFEQIDCVINGEGELPFVALLQRLKTDPGRVEDIAGLVGRNTPRSRETQVSQLKELRHLPSPDYHSYFDLLERLVAGPIVAANLAIPIESSRGCWWDRSARDPMMSCSFCNLNLQWAGYREKSVDQFAAELKELSETYNCSDFLLVDNILRYSEVDYLCHKIIELRKDFRIGMEARVSLKPREMELLSKAGVVYIQFGIEALSTDILKVIYKGTTCIQNVQAMKFCEQFGIDNISNIIVHHPGVAAESLREMLRNIAFVTCYRPLSCSHFTLSYQSPIFKNPARFGVTNVRNLESVVLCFPDAIGEQLFWLDKSFDLDCAPEIPSLWRDIEAAVEAWRQMYDERTRQFGVRCLLTYEDLGNRLTVVDYRADPPVTIQLDEASRALYLACETACSLEKVHAARPELSHDELTERLTALERQRVLFHEGRKYLALAVPAETVAAGARRQDTVVEVASLVK